MSVTRYEDEMGIWEKTDLGKGRSSAILVEILVEPAAKPAPEPKAKKPKKSKK